MCAKSDCYGCGLFKGLKHGVSLSLCFGPAGFPAASQHDCCDAQTISRYLLTLHRENMHLRLQKMQLTASRMQKMLRCDKGVAEKLFYRLKYYGGLNAAR